MVKHKYTKGQNLKYWLSFPASLLQLFLKKTKRPNGISVMIRVNNEEKWIARSLLSLNEFADEVVVLNNNSTDRTLEEINQIKSKLKYKLIVENEESNDICKVSNHALSLTSFRWIFRWDSDFVAYTSGERNIKYLKDWLLKLNPRKFYLIFPLTFSFAGDLFHVKTGKETNSEGYIHTWHSKLRYVKKGKFEILKVPFCYKIKRLTKFFFVHIGSAKSSQKLLHRFFWLYWQEHLRKFPQIDDFIKNELKTKFDGIEPKEFVVKEFKRLILPIRKFDKLEFGDYPELLQEEVENPELKIIYKDGKPFTRNDFA